MDNRSTPDPGYRYFESRYGAEYRICKETESVQRWNGVEYVSSYFDLHRALEISDVFTEVARGAFR